MIKQFDFDALKTALKAVDTYKLEKKNWGVAVSGGKDSMTLAQFLLKLKEKRNFNLAIIHVHHGLSGNKKTDSYRNSSLKFVKKFANQNKIKLLSNSIKKNKKNSEDDLRKIRHSFFSKLLEQKKIDLVVLGHHQMDLLETRVFRLLRGSGLQGLEAMSEWNGKFFRPLLKWDEAFLKKYADKHNIEFIEDPSNKDTKYFRNWMRLKLFKSLEAKRPGSTKALSRSLELIVEEIKQKSSSKNNLILESGIPRKKLVNLDKVEQKQVLALYLKKLGVRSYQHTHVEELLKRLDSAQKSTKFTMLKHEWHINSGRIVAFKK